MEKKKGYSMFERDKLDPADSMRIERNIYFEEQTADLSGLTALPLEQLQALREEYAAAEQAAFEALQEQAAAWDEQAGKTLAIDKAIEYVRTPEATHTANQWEATDYGKHISNRVYQMRYHISENTRYDREKEKSIPYSWTLSWSIYTNSPHNYGQAKIAGQERKVFADKAAMEKYLNGRIKAYQHLFTEVSPPIPPEYAEHFKVNGQLLPGYAIEGEERAQPTAEKAAPTTAEPPQDTEQRKERETINEQFSILIDSRSRFETGKPGGVWLPMPTTTEQLHAAMESVGITADNPQDFFINGYSSTEDCPFDLPLSVIQSASMDELNYFGKLLEMQSDGDKDKFAAAVTHGEYAGSMKDLINLAQNLDCYWLYPTVRSEEDYGYYLIDELDELELPEEAKKYFKYEEYGRDAVSKDKGQFTEQGYIYNNQNTFTEWYRGTENEIPKEYRVMSFPQPERGGQDKTFMDAAATEQTARTAAEQPQEPHPVIPIVLTAGKPAEKLKEITDRLEQGITELFDSERYKEYLKVMSKFHNYSFRNTVLIAMQKPDASLLAGFSAWKNNFERNVMRGQKGIKIIAPSPYKIKQEMQKIDPHTQKPIIGKDGKPVTEEKEITIPAYKVVSVFDVSQTEGKELPDIAIDELTGDVDRYKDFFAALEKTSPVPIAFENIEGGSHGYYHLEDKRIAINEGMSELQTLKTAIHEIAHAKLHDIDLNAPKDEQQPHIDRRTREVEAESVAYTVCQHYGLDTSDYSFGYVAGWSSGRELAELKSSLEIIKSTAAKLIEAIDGHFAEIQKEQAKGQAQAQPEAVTEPPETPAPEQPEAAPQKQADTAQETRSETPQETATTQETQQAAAPYYSINETAARRAKDMNSFYDYKPGSATAEYRSYIDEAVQIAERQKKRVDPMYHEKIDSLLDTYARKLAANMNKGYEIAGRVPSILIAGGSNFPTRKKEKQNAATDRNMQEYRDIQGLLDKIRSTGMGGISADDPQAVEKLQKKLAGLEKSQETMKAVNAYYRKHKTLDGCPHLPPEQLEKLKADMSSQWHLGDKPFASWALSNNNAEIRRVKDRIKSLSQTKEIGFVGWEFEGGRVEANTEANRLQIFFNNLFGNFAAAVVYYILYAGAHAHP